MQSCDGCASHQKIIEIAQGILLAADDVLSMNQPPPSVPQNVMDYVGVYMAEIGGVQVLKHHKVLKMIEQKLHQGVTESGTRHTELFYVTI